MNNKAQSGKAIGAVSQGIGGAGNVQFKFDTTGAVCNFATAKLVSAQPATSAQPAPVLADLRRPTAADYRYRHTRNSSVGAPLAAQGSPAVIRECQNAFAHIINAIGNPGATYHARQHNEIGMSQSREATMQIMPLETRRALDRQMSQTEFGMRWEPARQFFYGAGKVFANPGSTNTVPTHDLAHLLIGACGNLEWCPEGGDRDVRLAEYYAVFIENLFDKIYGHLIAGTFEPERVLHETINYSRWFVDVHYAPFPIPAEEAYRRFCWNIDVDAITRLSPLFFALKRVERTFPDYRDQIWELHFNTSDAPQAEQVAFAEKAS
jgi:hypothetical protein